MALSLAEEFVADLATPNDDGAIRQLLRDSVVPGGVDVSSDRSPSYFLSCGTMGRSYQVLVIRHQASRQLVALGYRGVQPRFVNGRAQRVGYITDMVVDCRFRGRWIYARLLRQFRELHAADPVPGYLGVIAAGHDRLARNVLSSPLRWELPNVTELATLWTLALLVRAKKPARLAGYEVTRGSRADLPRIIAFLNQHGPRRQFFPVYTEEDFLPDSPLTHSFDVEDFLLAWRAGRLVGVLGVWDRSAFKQTVVQAYRPFLRLAKPFYDRAARIARLEPLPNAGERVRSVYASFTCIQEDNPDVFHLLLKHAQQLAAERGYGYLMVGLSGSDPLLSVARRFLNIPYRSQIYTVSFRGEPPFSEQLDGRVPYLELVAV